MSIKESKSLIKRMNEIYDKFLVENNKNKKENLRKLFISTANKFKNKVNNL